MTKNLTAPYIIVVKSILDVTRVKEMIADKEAFCKKKKKKKEKKTRSILLTLPSTSMNTLSSTSLILQLSVNNSSSVIEKRSLTMKNSKILKHSTQF